MAISGATNRSSGVSSTLNATVTQTPGAIVAVGKQLVTLVSYSGGVSVQSVTDAVGNAWVFASRSVASNGYAVETWVCNVETQLASTTVITATLTGNAQDKCIASREYTVAAGKMLQESGSTAPIDNALTGAGFGSQTFSSLSSIERLYVRGGQKVSSSTTAITASANFTSWALAIRSRNNASAVILRAEERIVTGTTSGASNPTLAVSVITSATFVALEEVAIPLPERTGSLVVTLDDATVSAAGTVATTGALAQTLDSATLAATGTAAVTGSLAAILDDSTLEAAGTVADALPERLGALAVTLDDATVSASGTVAIGASLATTLDNATAAGSGTVAIAGTAAATLDDAAAPSTGTVATAGAAATTLDNAALSAAGTIAITGAASVPLDDSVLAAGGTVAIAGALSQQLDDAALTATGTTAVAGALATTLDDATLEAAGTLEETAEERFGSLDVTLDDATVSATGAVAISGAIAALIDDATLEAEGTVDTGELPERFGALAVTLDDATLSAIGAVAVTGLADVTLDDATLVASDHVPPAGEAIASLQMTTAAVTASLNTHAATAAVAPPAIVTLTLTV